MTYSLNPVIPAVAAEHSLTASPEEALDLVYSAWRHLFRQTRGLKLPDTLWLPPAQFHYFQCQPFRNMLDKTLMQMLLELNPTLRKVGQQPVLQALTVSPVNVLTPSRLINQDPQPISSTISTQQYQAQVMVLFNSRAVANPDCIGWLVGGESIHRPMETLAIVGI